MAEAGRFVCGIVSGLQFGVKICETSRESEVSNSEKMKCEENDMVYAELESHRIQRQLGFLA